MPTWLRYLLFQIPGWTITGTVLASLWHWQLITISLALLGFLAWLLKDLFLYPFLKPAYEGFVKTGSAALVGTHGIAQEDLDPTGYIRTRGELWRAIAVPGDHTIAAGTPVEIVSAKGMELFVRAAGAWGGEGER
jgi:membrane protein implicated in regulation of membrane protease activity